MKYLHVYGKWGKLLSANTFNVCQETLETDNLCKTHFTAIPDINKWYKYIAHKIVSENTDTDYNQLNIYNWIGIQKCLVE